MGKAGFAHLQGSGAHPGICEERCCGERGFELFHLRTSAIRSSARPPVSNEDNELSIWVEELFSFSAAPLPEKWHGLTDVELRYRQDIGPDRQ
jgi:lysyl-tRNA synthetase class II